MARRQWSSRVITSASPAVHKRYEVARSLARPSVRQLHVVAFTKLVDSCGSASFSATRSTQLLNSRSLIKLETISAESLFFLEGLYNPV